MFIYFGVKPKFEESLLVGDPKLYIAGVVKLNALGDPFLNTLGEV
jgi:hypothetical protein